MIKKVKRRRVAIAALLPPSNEENYDFSVK
jgi:hypothetical protein